MSTARSTPNIALIKYWGNVNDALRLPANSNLAMTLDAPYVDITVTQADAFSVTSHNKIMKEKDTIRLQQTLVLMEQYLSTIHYPLSFLLSSVSIEIDSHIPPSIGLASSAAVFSALAKAIAALVDGDLTDEQISVMARLGSGSAARSIFGGFVALSNQRMNELTNAIDACVAKEIAPPEHWPLHDIIIVPDSKEKTVGSTEGHANAWTSPHYRARVEAINNRRQSECIEAILSKDFEKLQVVAEEDCMDMHHCMQTQNPPLEYLSDDTYRIINDITALRKAEHLPVLYTMDAGPTVHLFCTDESAKRVCEFAHAQEGCTIFETGVGRGAFLL